jgi:glutamate-1-semialdehyde 2,1-aminomutase
MKKFDAIIQIRLNSNRLKNKGLLKINNNFIIELLIKRLKFSKKINKIIIATTKRKEDKQLSNIAEKLGTEIFYGDEKNVLKRFYEASKKHNSKHIIRITGDNPLIDFKILDKFIDYYKLCNPDFLYEGEKPKLPDGMGIEIISKKCLDDVVKNVRKKFDKEHVTTYIKKNSKKYLINTLPIKSDLSNYRFTLDDEIDFKNIKKIFNFFYPRINFNTSEIIKNIKNNKIILTKPISIRDEGSILDKNQLMWKNSKKLIPGGNGLLSKRPDLYMPDGWPTFYKKAKGYFIWDLENKKYSDLSMMGIGTNLLGYANTKIDNKVKKAISLSNMSTLNCPEENFLAKKLLDIHPWADQAKFARTGAEANAIAIRLSRSFTNNDKVAICGYHGWHDWYLSTNLNNKNNLKKHLLNGLKIQGVSRSLKDSVFSFDYNDFEGFYKLYKRQKFKTVIMEVKRNEENKNKFLEKIYKFCKKKKLVLIFDECTSGFRENYGGIHLKYNIYPDLCMFGKALGNGYAITAIIGKKKIMKHASKSFISSTFWTERIGFVSAIETLNQMKKLKSWEYISKLGDYIKKEWKFLAIKNNLEIDVQGIKSIPSFRIKSKRFLEYKTFITQEMLKKNILASNVIFVSTSHNKKILKKYFEILDKIFKKINSFEKNKIDKKKFLKFKTCQTFFTRLN